MCTPVCWSTSSGSRLLQAKKAAQSGLGRGMRQAREKNAACRRRKAQPETTQQHG